MIRFGEYISDFNSEFMGEDNVSLRETVNRFNEEYTKFLEDYQSLRSLDIAKEFNINFYDASLDGEIENLELSLYKVNPKYGDYNYLTLLLYHNTNGYGGVLHNHNDRNRTCEYREFISLDDELVQEYLAFGKKYNDFIEAYHTFRNGELSKNGLRVYSWLYEKELTSTGMKYHPKFINELEHIYLALSTPSSDGDNYFELSLGLNDKLGEVKVFKSLVSSEPYALNVEKIDQILDGVLVNVELLPKLFRRQQQKKLERVK